LNIKLKIAVGEYPHTAAVRNGSIPIEGVDPEFVTVQPQIAAFRRMVRHLEFDVCELAPTTYIIARAYEAAFKALPIFLMRRFHHAGLLVRPDAGIKKPSDLEGKKVGVRAYSVTTGVWTRGILANEFGLDCSKVAWVVDDEEHVTHLRLPPNVIHTTDGQSLARMMENGELAAGFQGNAGIGRSGSPLTGWKTEEATYPDLFPNAAELEAEWFDRTRIYPTHGTIVVKDSLLDVYPWIGKSIFEAFSRAKNQWLERLDTNGSPENKRYSALCKIVGGDPLPYGLVPNLTTIKALEEFAFQQGLTPGRISVDELFVDPEK
jgi:4,5-dihydroxyphthalate decarboxylase